MSHLRIGGGAAADLYHDSGASCVMTHHQNSSWYAGMTHHDTHTHVCVCMCVCVCVSKHARVRACMRVCGGAHVEP